MTPDERVLLTRFLGDLGQSKVASKDREAADLIAEAIRANPDAPYLLVQHALLADQAIAAAQSRIDDLERRVREPAPSQSFLGGGGGFGAGRWGQAPASAGANVPPPAAGPWGRSGNAQPEPAYAPQAAQGGGVGSFLRTAAGTAAGVAGGALLFQGISNMLGGHGGEANAAGLDWPDNVTVNEYYGGGGDRFDNQGPTEANDRLGVADNDPGDAGDFSGGDDSDFA